MVPHIPVRARMAQEDAECRLVEEAERIAKKEVECILQRTRQLRASAAEAFRVKKAERKAKEEAERQQQFLQEAPKLHGLVPRELQRFLTRLSQPRSSSAEPIAQEDERIAQAVQEADRVWKKLYPGITREEFVAAYMQDVHSGDEDKPGGQRSKAKGERLDTVFEEAEEAVQEADPDARKAKAQRLDAVIEDAEAQRAKEAAEDHKAWLAEAKAKQGWLSQFLQKRKRVEVIEGQAEEAEEAEDKAKDKAKRKTRASTRTSQGQGHDEAVSISSS